MIIGTVTNDLAIISQIVMKIITTGVKTSIANTIRILPPDGAIGASIAGSIETIVIFTMTGPIPTIIVMTEGGIVGGIRGDSVGGMAIGTGMVMEIIETDVGTIRTDNIGTILEQFSGGGKFLPQEAS
jgi:hypothetical protein